jgi:hypothetical protein
MQRLRLNRLTPAAPEGFSGLRRFVFLQRPEFGFYF